MKWYLLNFTRRLRFAAANPGYAFKAALRELTLADERFLASATGAETLRIRAYLQEPATTPDFAAHLRKCEADFLQGRYSADLWAKKILVQYAAVRALRPETVIETGVASGVSSSYLLLALHRNQKGMLHSVEVGDSSYLPPSKEPGWIVPEWLRPRWQLHIGDSSVVLPELVRKFNPVDIFIHDSLHSYEHMKFEFEVAHPHVRRGGLIMADDALWNRAFCEFAAAMGSTVAQIVRGVGVMRT